MNCALAGSISYKCPDSNQPEYFAIIVDNNEKDARSVVISAVGTPGSAKFSPRIIAFNCKKTEILSGKDKILVRTCEYEADRTGYTKLISFDEKELTASFMRGRNFIYKSEKCTVIK